MGILDIGFFIIFPILLFNVITGLIVDNFTSLREEHARRTVHKKNVCFVCGYSRGNFDDLGASYNFEEHISNAHYTWNYVFFIAYLISKDPDEYNGVESYVNSYYRAENLDWIPQKSSWKIQTDELRVKKKQTIEQQNSVVL